MFDTVTLATKQNQRMNKFLNLIFLLFVAVSCKPQNTDLNVTESQSFSRVMGENSWGFVNQVGDTIIPLNKYKFLNPIDDEEMILALLIFNELLSTYLDISYSEPCS